MLKKLLLAIGLLSSVAASANVVIVGTRVIYPSDAKSINIQLQNAGATPALVQSWVDEGNPKTTASNTKAPFVVTPPMVRVEPKSGQILRLMFKGGKKLPQDRESLFYFNLLDVPSKPKASDIQGKNYLQFAIRSRLKLFYRPASLKMPITTAYKKVEWKSLGGNRVEIFNNSPYHITYDVVQVGKQVSRNLDMIAPFSKLTVTIPGAKRGDKVKWAIINDHGGQAIDETIIK